MSVPPGWPLVAGAVVVDAPTSAVLAPMVAEVRRRARVDGWSLPPSMAATLDALERLGAAQRGTSAPEPTWIGTGEAAELLGVSVRRVVALLAEGKLEGRKHGRRWLVDAADVILRLPSEPLGTPTESDGGPLCA